MISAKGVKTLRGKGRLAEEKNPPEIFCLGVAEIP